MRSLSSVVLTLLILVATQINAQDFERGLAASNRGDFINAFKEWLPLAESGDSLSQYNIGMMHYNGARCGPKQN